MAQTGFTTIQIYSSPTAAATPSAGNLAAGELALNTTDEKLYFKNTAGAVKLLAANLNAIANGGTGQTTAAAAITALAGSQTSGYYLRSDGTNTALAAIVAADVPTLNQNTTGTADNVTGTVAVANGGTGQTTYTNGQLLIGNSTGNTLAKATLTAGANISITNSAGGITIAATGGGSGSVTSVDVSGGTTGLTTSGGPITGSGTITIAGTLAAANGGTGLTALGTGVATFLGTPSSANLLAAVTDETGSGPLVFATAPSLSGVVINDGYTEEVFAASGTTPALSPTNGSIQTWTLSGDSTPTAGTWAAGQSLTLMIDDGTAYTITWTSVPVTWKTNGGTAPTLNTTGFTAIQLWKVGAVIYGARVGDA